MYQDAIEANYSHEMNTPLNSILSNCSIILNKIKKLDVDNCPNHKKHYIEMIKFNKANQKMSKQIQKSA